MRQVPAESTALLYSEIPQVLLLTPAHLTLRGCTGTLLTSEANRIHYEQSFHMNMAVSWALNIGTLFPWHVKPVLHK